MRFPDFVKAFDAAAGSVLTSFGFKRERAGRWSRLKDGAFSLIGLQKHSVKDSLCVNLGVHCAFMIEEPGNERAQDPGLDVPSSVIRERLTEADGLGDQWWPIAPATVDVLPPLLRGRAMAFFDGYRIDGELRRVTAEAVESRSNRLLSTLTQGEACRVLALLWESLGDAEKCLRFAELGLRLANPRASEFRARIRRIIERVGRAGDGAPRGTA